jgi:outer membrane protein TolC
VRHIQCQDFFCVYLREIICLKIVAKKWFVEKEAEGREKSVKSFFRENLWEISPILAKLVTSLTVSKKWFVETQTTAKKTQTTANKINFQTSHFSFLTFLFLLTLHFSLFTGETKAQSLDDYLIQAAENNPGLKASYARYQAAAERVSQPSLTDPELQVGVFPRPMERFMGIQTADFQLMQMFPWFGMIGTQKEEATQMAKAQYQLFLEEKNQLLFQVKSTWYELIRLQEEVKISRENLEYFKKYEDLALVRFQVGTSSSSTIPSPTLSQSNTSSSSSAGSSGMNTMGGTDKGMTSPTPMSSGMQPTSMANSPSGMSIVLQIRMQIIELENTIEQLQANLEPLNVKFNQLLNRDIRQLILLPSQLEKPQLTLSKQEILDSIRQNNPMLAMYDAEMAGYDQQSKMARLEGKPMLGAGVNYMTFAPRPENGMLMGGENMVMPMVSISLPIYRKRITSKVKEVEYLKESAQLDRKKTENLLAMDWANAFRNWEESERNLKLYEKQLTLLNQQIKLLETSFSTNNASFEEVLQAQQQLLDYQLKRLNALNQQHQSLSLLEALVSSSLTF